MLRLYKYMSCPLCHCSTCTKNKEIYECAACHERWMMLEPIDKKCDTCDMRAHIGFGFCNECKEHRRKEPTNEKLNL